MKGHGFGAKTGLIQHERDACNITGRQTLGNSPSHFLFAVALQSQLIIITGPGILHHCTRKMNVSLPGHIPAEQWHQHMKMEAGIVVGATQD